MKSYIEYYLLRRLEARVMLMEVHPPDQRCLSDAPESSFYHDYCSVSSTKLSYPEDTVEPPLDHSQK
jgi:hypothetical protein